MHSEITESRPQGRRSLALAAGLAVTLVVSALSAGTAFAGAQKLPANTAADSRAVYHAGNIHDGTCPTGQTEITASLGAKISDPYITITSPPQGAFVVYGKGGPAYNQYDFAANTPGPIVGLHPPVNNGGNIAGISHWFACGSASVDALNVYFGYADGGQPNGHPGPTTPLEELLAPAWGPNSPNTYFYGYSKAGYDAGAVRIDNNSSTTVTLTSATVSVGSHVYDIWSPFALVVPAHGHLVLTQTKDWNFDTSDEVEIDNVTDCVNPPSTVIPVAHITVNGHTTDVADSHQTLLTHGQDIWNCTGGNESLPWQLEGTAAF
jgi:hypothetical protein